MPILFGSLNSGSSTSQRSYIAIQMTNEGNLIGVPSSLYFAQVCLIIPSRCSSHHYIFPFYAMFTTASNMLSFESEPRRVLVILVDIIFSTIFGVVYWIWLIIKPYELFAIGVLVSVSTRIGFELMGTDSPLFNNPLIL